MNRLQVRILVAFVLVLIVTVGIIGAVLMLFLRSRPVPTQPIINELAATSVQTDFRTLIPARVVVNGDSLTPEQQKLLQTFGGLMWHRRNRLPCMLIVNGPARDAARDLRFGGGSMRKA